MQSFDNRTEFLSSRHHHTRGSAQRLGFFLQITGEGIWCQDGEFFAEYFDSLDLSGNPIATECELDVPNWHWHSLTPPGVPPPMFNGQARTLEPMLFSARWTTRLGVAESAEYLLSSHANKGSRILGGHCDNVSLLWDHAVASAGGVAGNSDAVTNWTSAALDSDASTGLFVRYIDSDPCFDLWPGTTCSLSHWSR
eukprot:COSAG04_NODE_438_length_14426_cov_10.589795_2_plen_196_part_00